MDYGKLYNENYYKTSCGEIPYLETDKWMPFFENVADNIIKSLHPSTVLDVGCATGYLVAALRDRGVEAYGIDVSEFAISTVREDIKPFCRVCSALDPLPADLPQKYDLVVTIEVAEHLYEEDGKKFIENICKYSNQIIFSSTSEDITEKTHFNVQQPEYWAKRFADNGFYKNLLYDASYISPYAFLYGKGNYEISKLVYDYERKTRIVTNEISSLRRELGEREKQIINLDNILSEKENQIDNLERANNAQNERINECNKYYLEILKERDEKIKELEQDIQKKNRLIEELDKTLSDFSIENENNKRIIMERDARIQEFIQASQWLHDEVKRWKTSFNQISNSACWHMTKPIRVILDIIKKISYHFIQNTFSHNLKKVFNSIRTSGLKNTIIKIQYKLREKSHGKLINYMSTINTIIPDQSVSHFLNTRMRNLQPVQTVIIENGPRRLNIVTDSIESNSLLGGVATALILATEFANTNNLALRIITRTTPINPVDYLNIMKISGIRPADNVIYYSDYNRDEYGMTDYKLEISKNDIFFATSWWSAEAIKHTSLNKKFFYIIQEVETFFYPHGDEHYLCSQIMKDKDIYFIVNSHYLYEYFAKYEPNIVEHGVYFEPAFPRNLYHPKHFVNKSKYKLFFYARPNNPRNMFGYGLKMIDKSIQYGILDTNEWDIYCAGQSIPELRFSNGYKAFNLGLLSWKEYAEFLGEVDLALSLMYTPHPSYPPFDVACSGGVVITNNYINKDAIDWCQNIIVSDMREEEFLSNMENAILLAKNTEKRKKNYENSKIPRVWQDTLSETLKYMGEMLNHVQD